MKRHFKPTCCCIILIMLSFLCSCSTNTENEVNTPKEYELGTLKTIEREDVCNLVYDINSETVYYKFTNGTGRYQTGYFGPYYYNDRLLHYCPDNDEFYTFDENRAVVIIDNDSITAPSCQLEIYK